MKKYIKSFTHGVSLFCILFVFSCKTPSSLVKNEPLNLPGTFTGETDTVSIGAEQRRVFFKDTVLTGLIDIALAQNIDLQNTLQKVSIARADMLSRKGLGLPAVDVFASAGMDKYGKYTMSGVGNFDTNLSSNIDKDQQVTDPAQDFFLGLKSHWDQKKKLLMQGCLLQKKEGNG